MKKIVLICLIGQSIYADNIFTSTYDSIVKRLELRERSTHMVSLPSDDYGLEEGKPSMAITAVSKNSNFYTEENRDSYQRVNAQINFKSASKDISSDSYKLLKIYGSAIEDGVTSSKLVIEGHTDSVGTDEYNEKLAYARANAVKEFLVSFYNISPDRLIVKAYGERKPLESNKTKYGRMINRRVTFVRIE